MTNKILENEIMTDEELNNVQGATVSQLNELTSAFANNNKILGAFEDVRQFFSGTKLGSLSNIVMAYTMESFLKNDFKINSNISVGWGGTGFRESGNSYSDKFTGEALSHEEVVQRVKNYGKVVLG